MKTFSDIGHGELYQNQYWYWQIFSIKVLALESNGKMWYQYPSLIPIPYKIFEVKVDSHKNDLLTGLQG